MRHHLKCAIIVILFTWMPASYAQTPEDVIIDYGIKPDDVYGLWTSINSGLIRLAEMSPSSQTILQHLQDIQPRHYTHKESKDVLQKAITFRDKLNGIRYQNQLGATQATTNASNVEVTSTVTFLISGHILDSIADLLLAINPKQKVSPIYQTPLFFNKTSSDVYSLVDQANRKIDVISEILYKQSQGVEDAH